MTFLDPEPSCSDALKNTFHYSSSNEAGYDYLKVIANLNAREPVLLAASTDLHTFLGFNIGYYTDGHEWVCDGYEQVNYTWCPSNGSPGGGGGFLYLHMNWGWNEYFNPNNSNGYYAFDHWSVLNGSTTENLLYNQSMTYNIHP